MSKTRTYEVAQRTSHWKVAKVRARNEEEAFDKFKNLRPQDYEIEEADSFDGEYEIEEVKEA